MGDGGVACEVVPLDFPSRVSLPLPAHNHTAGISCMAFADVDGDGSNELIVACLCGTLAVYKPRRNTAVWACHRLGSITALSVGDPANTGGVGLLLAAAEGIAHFFDFTSTPPPLSALSGGDTDTPSQISPSFSFRIPGNAVALAIAPVVGESRQQIVLGTRSRQLFISELVEEGGWRLYDRRAMVTLPFQATDIAVATHSGQPCIVVGMEQGVVCILPNHPPSSLDVPSALSSSSSSTTTVYSSSIPPSASQSPLAPNRQLQPPQTPPQPQQQAQQQQAQQCKKVVLHLAKHGVRSRVLAGLQPSLHRTVNKAHSSSGHPTSSPSASSSSALPAPTTTKSHVLHSSTSTSTSSSSSSKSRIKGGKGTRKSSRSECVVAGGVTSSAGGSPDKTGNDDRVHCNHGGGMGDEDGVIAFANASGELAIMSLTRVLREDERRMKAKMRGGKSPLPRPLLFPALDKAERQQLSMLQHIDDKGVDSSGRSSDSSSSYFDGSSVYRIPEAGWARQTSGEEVVEDKGENALEESQELFRHIKLDGRFLAVQSLDVTGDGQDEVIGCTWDGVVYFLSLPIPTAHYPAFSLASLPSALSFSPSLTGRARLNGGGSPLATAAAKPDQDNLNTDNKQGNNSNNSHHSLSSKRSEILSGSGFQQSDIDSNRDAMLNSVWGHSGNPSHTRDHTRTHSHTHSENDYTTDGEASAAGQLGDDEVDRGNQRKLSDGGDNDERGSRSSVGSGGRDSGSGSTLIRAPSEGGVESGRDSQTSASVHPELTRAPSDEGERESERSQTIRDSDGLPGQSPLRKPSADPAQEGERASEGRRSSTNQNNQNQKPGMDMGIGLGLGLGCQPLTGGKEQREVPFTIPRFILPHDRIEAFSAGSFAAPSMEPGGPCFAYTTLGGSTVEVIHSIRVHHSAIVHAPSSSHTLRPALTPVSCTTASTISKVPMSRSTSQQAEGGGVMGVKKGERDGVLKGSPMLSRTATSENELSGVILPAPTFVEYFDPLGKTISDCNNASGVGSARDSSNNNNNNGGGKWEGRGGSRVLSERVGRVFHKKPPTNLATDATGKPSPPTGTTMGMGQMLGTLLTADVRILQAYRAALSTSLSDALDGERDQDSTSPAITMPALFSVASNRPSLGRITSPPSRLSGVSLPPTASPSSIENRPAGQLPRGSAPLGIPGIGNSRSFWQNFKKYNQQ